MSGTVQSVSLVYPYYSTLPQVHLHILTVYLCDGPIGPVYPHELAFQAHQGQAAAARRPPGRAITPAPAPAAAAAAAPLPANAPNAAPARAGRANATTNTNARVTRASQRLRNQTNATEAGNLNQVGADKELSQGRSSVASVNAEGSAGPSSSSASATARVKREMTEEEDDHDERDGELLAFEARVLP